MRYGDNGELSVPRAPECLWNVESRFFEETLDIAFRISLKYWVDIGVQTQIDIRAKCADVFPSPSLQIVGNAVLESDDGISIIIRLGFIDLEEVEGRKPIARSVQKSVYTPDGCGYLHCYRRYTLYTLAFIMPARSFFVLHLLH
jgi:hypothetical protein